MTPAFILAFCFSLVGGVSVSHLRFVESFLDNVKEQRSIAYLVACMICFVVFFPTFNIIV